MDYISYTRNHSLVLFTFEGPQWFVIMPKVSNYKRTQIELLHKQALHPAGIFRSSKSRGLLVRFPSISRVIKKLQITGFVANLLHSGRPAKLSVDARAFIDQQMQKVMTNLSGEEIFLATIVAKLSRSQCFQASTSFDNRSQIAAF